MPRELKPRSSPGYPYTCTYRRGCKGEIAFDYVVPSKTRWGNPSTRHKYVCRDCAEIIRVAYRGTVG